MLNSINSNVTNQFAKTSNTTTNSTSSILNSAEDILAAATAQSEETNVDTFEVSNSTDTSGIYSASDITAALNGGVKAEDVDVAALSAARMDDFSNMLSKMIDGQAKESSTASDIYADASAKAQESIEEGGRWSAENVADDILNFAKALAGDDPENFAILKEAVEKGFEAAEEAWGGELPSITNDTYDKVMAGFDAWEKELFGDSTEVQPEDQVEDTTEVE